MQKNTKRKIVEKFREVIKKFEKLTGKYSEMIVKELLKTAKEIGLLKVKKIL